MEYIKLKDAYKIWIKTRSPDGYPIISYWTWYKRLRGYKNLIVTLSLYPKNKLGGRISQRILKDDIDRIKYTARYVNADETITKVIY